MITSETLKGFLKRFMETFRLARNPKFSGEWAWVITGGVAWTLGALCLAAQSMSFEFKGTPDVYGWIALNNYPKQQEFFIYLLAFAAVPPVLAAVAALWIACSSEVSRVFSESSESSLRATARAFPLILWLLVEAYNLRVTIVSLVAWPAAAAALGFAVVPALRRFQSFGWFSGEAAAPPVAGRREDDPRPPSVRVTANEVRADVLTRTVRFLAVLSDAFRIFSGRTRRLLPQDPREMAALRGRLFRLTVYIAAPALLYLLLLDYNLLDLNIDLFHEGEFLAPLNEVLRGRTPFRDFYIQHGLFSNVTLPYIASRIFGATLEGWRLFLCLILPLGYVCIYFLALQIFRSPLTALILIPVAHVAGLYRIERFSFGLISVALAAGFAARRRGWRAFLSGAAAILAFFHSTEIGLYALTAVSVFFSALAVLDLARATRSARPACSVRDALRPLALFAAGAAACLVPFLLTFAFKGSLYAFFETIYRQCALQISIWGLHFPSYIFYRQTTEENFLQFLKSDVFHCYLPMLWLVIGEAYLVHQCILRRFTASNLKFLLLWLWSVVFFRTALGRSDGPHILRGGMMVWLIWFFFLERAVSSFARLSKNLGRGYNRGLALRCAGRAAFVLVSLGYIYSVRGIWTVPPMDEQGFGHKGFYLTPDESERYSRTGLFLSGAERDSALSAFGEEFLQEQKAHINDVSHYIRQNTSADDPIFDFSNQGAYYFFADRPSATRYFQIVHAADGSMQREVVADLEKKKPKIVIFQTNGMYDNIDHIPMSDRLPIIAEYLHEHYEPVENIRGTILLRPKSHIKSVSGRGA